MNRRNIKFVAGISIIAAGIAFLVVSATSNDGHTTDYYHTVAEFQPRSGDYVDRVVRVNGSVRTGSIRRTPARNTGSLPVLEFQMGDSTHVLTVRYEGTTVPDAFAEGANLVVEGVFQRNGILRARQLLVKCPSKYDTADSAEAY